MPEITPEQVARAAKRFGVSEEEVLKQWQEVASLGGEDAVRASLLEMIAETERDVEDLVATARVYLDHSVRREQGYTAFYVDVFNQIGDQELDSERVLQFLVVAAWKLAEAERREATLLDGSRRIAKEEK